MNAWLQRWNPAVPRWVLPLLAGVVWTGVGIMLLARAAGWFAGAERSPLLWITLAVGLVMAAGMIPGMFLKLARKNLARMQARPERTCLFSVFAWRSWGIALFMSILGGTLRRSGINPLYLAGPYLGMGLCLLSGGVLFLRHIRR